MCGRYTVTVDAEELCQELDLEGEPPALPARYNVAPSQEVPAVVDRAPRKLVLLRWGLVPFWAKDRKIGHRMINARAESVADKPAFRRSFEGKRCLIVADGFYEWRREGKVKIPVYVRLPSGRPFTFAGLWDAWRGPEGEAQEPLRTCTIITTEAAPAIADIHDRMPVILPPEARALWLDRDASPEQLQRLLRPFDGDLVSWEVSRLVNRPDNDVPECIEPVAE